MPRRALTGAAVFDGVQLLKNKAVVFEEERPVIVDASEVAGHATCVDLGGGTLMPGFVDLQVNGGGGIMFNDAPTPQTLRIMATAHHTLGTRGLLATLITDTPAKTTAAIGATMAAISSGQRGILGLHLEGPHLSVTRKGAHDAMLIRPMTGADCQELVNAARNLPNLMLTVAPESVSAAQIAELTAAGAVVFLGHSDASFETASAALADGACGMTHLFNAMSPLSSRAPGMVGAALSNDGIYAGLIADGLHVHPATIRAAVTGQAGKDRIFLVSDAMATAGSDISSFELGGRMIRRETGRLTLADGTLAGADLEMAQALRVMIEDVGDTPETAYRRATSIPAAVLRAPGSAGHWPAHIGDLIYLTSDYAVLPGDDLF